ncbi:TetR family transcriptional regulator [Bradyrhizobium sp. GCM10027634]|uniref:TetR family transcriptional regulator n=1 Tax=unclassified Bradyrhizobium TaxID=2631580 RepID=UPI00188A5266|nr:MULTISPECIES: TetR family transcriptional regulator [unclassified Bradyrhizobium]MDN4999848.1 TetR family transcriptional regulator [Bradyrhizobium sp. WYCCWR 12677]QOZ43257.1 TetR/AcrR family transcriptional regulator [Bradyrhizobium sp. CCBAU 53340]
MRYEKGHKDETRRHILDVASAQFRESGIAAVGLAGIMSEAGLTNGAFYTHFASKEDLVREVLLDALTRREERHKANLENGVAVETVIRDYLSARHRDRAGTGCPTAALVAEIARHPKATRDAFTGKVSDIVALMAEQIRHGTADERRRKAITVYSTMVGALQLARAVNDKTLSDEILENAVDAAVTIANER